MVPTGDGDRLGALLSEWDSRFPIPRNPPTVCPTQVGTRSPGSVGEVSGVVAGTGWVRSDTYMVGVRTPFGPDSRHFRGGWARVSPATCQYDRSSPEETGHVNRGRSTQVPSQRPYRYPPPVE